MDIFKRFTGPFQRGFKNASFMGIGTFLAQVIGFVGFLFMARLFGPTKFGIYNTVFAFVTIFHLFTLSGFQKVIVREGSNEDRSLSRILNKTIGLKLFCVLIAFVLCVGVSFFTNYSPFVKVLIIIFSTEIIHFGLDSFLETIYQTTEKMQYIAFFQILMKVLITGLSILFLYFGAGVLIILLINLFSRIGVLSLNYFWSRRFCKFRFNMKIHFEPEIFKALIVFSLMGFINTLAVKIDVLMITFLSTSSDVGIYSVAHEMGREGLILRNILAIAFFPIAVRLFKSSKVRVRTVLFYSIGLFFLVLLGCILVFFFAEDLITLLFKKEYLFSGHILKYLVFYLPFAFSTLPFTISLQATHNEKIVLIVMCITAAVNIPLNLVLFSHFGLIGIAYSTIVVFFLSAAFMSFLSIKRMKRQGFLI